MFDRLYPIKPWIFGTTFGAASHYFYVHPSGFASRFGPSIGYVVAGFLVAIVPVIVLRSFLYLFFFRYKGHLFESTDKLSWTSRFWGLCYLLLRRYAPPRLLSCNAFLPKQPVPPIKHTLLYYMKSMEPLMESVSSTLLLC